MKKFDIKSLVLGLIIGAIGFSTVLGVAAAPLLGKIESATFSNSKVYFYGKEIPLTSSLVEIVKSESNEAELYMPMREILEYMQFNVKWDKEDDSVNITMNGYNGYDNHNGSTTLSEHKKSSDYIKNDTIDNRNKIVIDLKNQNTYNIAKSGSFQAEENQVLTLNIISDIKGGSVDLFLFNPSGQEQRITINSEKSTMEINLTQGLWTYNCTGMFKDGGDIQIIGTIGE